MRRTLLLAATLLAATACGEPPSPGARSSVTRPVSAQKYRATGMVLQQAGAEPVLCLGAVMESLPPQCGGMRIDGWDWDGVSGEESAGGAVWGDFEITGRYDGETFTVIKAGLPRDPPADDDPITSACPEPSGGWDVPDSERTSEVDRDRAIRAAHRQADFAGAWIDYVGAPDEFVADADIVLNVAFTGELGRHEEEIRAHWGGPLCVTVHEHTRRRLREIQNDLGAAAEEIGVQVLWSSISETGNFVEIGVVVADAETREKIDERYGAGTVEMSAQLRPVP